MTFAFHQIFSGIANGSMYACLGLALVMIYRASHHINFAQGEFAMFSTYIAWMLIQAGVSYWAAFALTLVFSFAGGVLVERIILRPVEKAPILATVIVFVALLMIVNSLAGWLFGYTMQTFPSPFPERAWYGNTYLSAHQMGTIAVTLVVLLAVFLFFRFSKVGLAMRAAAQNSLSSTLVGVRVGRTLALGWGLAAAIGAVAGLMAAPIVYLEPSMMSGMLLYGFAAALLGGINNPWGAAAGGFIVGVFENLAGAYLVGTDLKLTLALAVIVGVLLIRPSGLFGQVVVTRV